MKKFFLSLLLLFFCVTVPSAFAKGTQNLHQQSSSITSADCMGMGMGMVIPLDHASSCDQGLSDKDCLTQCAALQVNTMIHPNLSNLLEKEWIGHLVFQPALHSTLIGIPASPPIKPPCI
ncbi:hypothetical protein LIN78_13455 [Leeia sp. TBRC 13508]|uniref:Uncharacterized protein n=1 Tax=Leeia speluncae TaxID=2884804 RepID=A0ABS8D8Q4_9NEIS|nr:hypothetical protein [Leeia speluncae]MCB6184549.1 hypothetical protein [Leeia speluncae]